jgi:hypothetical protein
MGMGKGKEMNEARFYPKKKPPSSKELACACWNTITSGGR